MEGSCHCREVRFTFSPDIKAILNCHCGLCRKMNGSAFSTYVVVPSNEFTLICGDLHRVQVSDNASKTLCTTCGTPIFNENPQYAGLKILYLGAIDNAEHLAPAVNTYCESQLEWLQQLGNLKQMAKGFN